jgi:hypothetical protein
VVELSGDDNLTSPEMDKTKDHPDDPDDKELEDLMAVESTAQACIMSALRIVSYNLKIVLGYRKSKEYAKGQLHIYIS